MINRPINSISFKVRNVEEVDILSKMLKKGGDVEVSINVVSSDKAYKVKLKDRRFIDRKTVNLIKNQGILSTIHWFISCLYSNKFIKTLKNTHKACG